MASNRIKGITIEIDGNTVKLQDSLKNVNSSLRATQKDLKDVNKLLKLDPKNTELLKQKTELLNSAISDTTIKLEKEREALEALEKAGDSEKTIEQQKALRREIAENEQALKQYRNELKEMPNAFNKIASATDNLANKTKLLSTTALAGVTALGAMAVKAGAMADDLNTMSKQSGFSTEEIQKWQYASDRIDVSIDTIVKAGAKLTKNMGSSTASVTEAFDKLGVKVTDVEGNMRPVQDVFYETIEALSLIPNEVERDQLAMDLFGKSANELAGIIDDGGEALRTLGEEAMNAGMILSQDALDGANAFNDGLDKIKAQAQATFYSVGSQLAETLLPLMEELVTHIGNILEWVANLDSGTLKLIGTILLATASLSTILKTISGVFSALNTISSFLPVLTAGITTVTGTAVTGATTASTAIGALTVTTGGLVAVILAVVTALGLAIKAFADYTNAKDKAKLQERFDSTTSTYGQKLRPGEEKYYNPDDYVGFYNGNGGFDYYAKNNSKASLYRDEWAENYLYDKGQTNYNFDVNVDHINDLQDLIDMSNNAQMLERMGGN